MKKKNKFNKNRERLSVHRDYNYYNHYVFNNIYGPDMSNTPFSMQNKEHTNTMQHQPDGKTEIYASPIPTNPQPAVNLVSGNTPILEQAIQRALHYVVQLGLIHKKQDYRAIHRIIHEHRLYDRFELNDLLGVIKRSDCVPPQLMPSISAMKNLNIGTECHPNWKVAGKSMEETDRLVSLASAFITYFWQVFSMQNH